MATGGKKLLTHEDFVQALDLAQERITAAVGGGLYLVANSVITEAKKLVPHDTGTLSRSGYVALPAWDGGRFGVELGFGGFASAYAVAQHERTDYAHPEGRQAKYLEQPLNDSSINSQSDVVAIANQLLARGGDVRLPSGSAATSPYVGSLAARESGIGRRKIEKKERQRIRKKFHAMLVREGKATAKVKKERTRVAKKARKLDLRDRKKAQRERSRLRKKLHKTKRRKRR